MRMSYLQFIEYSEYDLSAYLLKEYGISRDEVFAEVKQFNKRRKNCMRMSILHMFVRNLNLIQAKL